MVSHTNLSHQACTVPTQLSNASEPSRIILCLFWVSPTTDSHYIYGIGYSHKPQSHSTCWDCPAETPKCPPTFHWNGRLTTKKHPLLHQARNSSYMKSLTKDLCGRPKVSMVGILDRPWNIIDAIGSTSTTPNQREIQTPSKFSCSTPRSLALQQATLSPLPHKNSLPHFPILNPTQHGKR